ncbi:hypothetical protein ACIQUB_21245 [Rhizobium sp. NPDC090275]|uniref:hypothetical protein n=1 Tax=Rhizobium sp. NPDC090275 TaxID=3364498 RepID=UPI00383A8655
MPTLVLAATAYLALAMLLVVVVDNLVAFFFREKPAAISIRRSAFERIAAVSRWYGRK